jgi:hypothetical protein
MRAQRTPGSTSITSTVVFGGPTVVVTSENWRTANMIAPRIRITKTNSTKYTLKSLFIPHLPAPDAVQIILDHMMIMFHQDAPQVQCDLAESRLLTL